MTKLFQILLVIGLTAVYINAQTCGEGPAVASFEADVYSKIANKGMVQSSYTAWKASAAVETANIKVPGVCESLFTGKKSCCSKTNDAVKLFKDIYKTFLDEKLNLGGSFMGFGPKKNFKADALEGEITTGLMKCMADYIKKHPELNKTTSASASASVSMSMSMQIPSSMLKAQKALKNVEKKAEGLIKKGIAEMGLMSLRLFRGTMCALCMDPDAPLASIWDGGVLVKDSDVAAIKEKVKKNLADSITAAQDKNKVLKIKQKATLTLLECNDVIKKIDDYKPQDLICPSDDGCTKTADAAVTSAWVVSDGALTVDNPTSRRGLQSTSLQASASGIAGQTEDATEDGNVRVQGQTANELQTEANAADTELKAEPLNEADAEAMYNVPGSSNIVAVTLSIIAFLLVSLL